MADTIRLHFTPDGKDYSRVMRAHSLRTPALWLSLAGMVVVLLLFLWAFTSQSRQCLLLWLLVAGAPLIASLAVFVWQPYRMRLQVDHDPSLRRDTTMQFDDTQVVITTGTAESRLGWDAFRQVVETRTDFLLCLSASKHMVRFVPKRAFQTPQREQAFRRLVRAKLPAGRWM